MINQPLTQPKSTLIEADSMTVKTNVKAGPTPIYMSINDTGVRR